MCTCSYSPAVNCNIHMTIKLKINKSELSLIKYYMCINIKILQSHYGVWYINKGKY